MDYTGHFVTLYGSRRDIATRVDASVNDAENEIPTDGHPRA